MNRLNAEHKLDGGHFSIKFVSLGILGLLTLTGGSIYLLNSNSKFSLFSSPCPSNGELIRTLEGHSDWVRSVTISEDGHTIVSGSADKTMKVWNLKTGELLHTLKPYSNWVNSVAISKNKDSQKIFMSEDAQTIISGNRDTIKVWNLKTGGLLRTLKGHADWVQSVDISEDGQTIVSGSDDTDIRVWRNQL